MKKQKNDNSKSAKKSGAAKPGINKNSVATGKRNAQSEKPEKGAIGRTIKTQDKYLPIEKGKKSVPKDKRWIAVIDRNEKGELAVVKLTTENQKNTTELKNYKKGNGKTTYFKHFVEIEDNNGNPIKIDGVRFVENPKKNDLTQSQVRQVQNKVLHHSKQATENKKKIAALKGGKKKGK